MTLTADSRTSGPDADVDAVRAELRSFLADAWDPDITVLEWWARLAGARWTVPTWPVEAYGRGLSRDFQAVVAAEIRDAGAIGPPGGLGLLLAGPTIYTHGTEEQRERYLPDIVHGRVAWCQLFSEPGAGSDLAGLQTKAELDGEEWIINGQKVWTSGGHHADLGMLLARTDPESPKHKGISWFAFDMNQPGVDVRPLREMTGRALFNEVFLTDARVPDANVIGGLNNGWAVANTTLMFERAGLGAGGGGAASSAAPGRKAGMIDRRAGDFAGRTTSGTGAAIGGSETNRIIELAKATGRVDDPMVRQELMRLYTYEKIARYMTLRAKSGVKIPGAPNIAKLTMSAMTRMSREISLDLLGPGGTLWGKDAPFDGVLQEMAVFSPAVSIYGGSDEIQRNIIGERVLGLPGEPRTDKDLPFKDLRVASTSR